MTDQAVVRSKLWLLILGVFVLGAVAGVIAYLLSRPTLTVTLTGTGALQYWETNTATLPECNGVFVGPNAFLTAGHCDLVRRNRLKLARIGTAEGGEILTSIAKCTCLPGDCSRPPTYDIAICQIDDPWKVGTYPQIRTNGALPWRVFPAAVGGLSVRTYLLKAGLSEPEKETLNCRRANGCIRVKKFSASARVGASGSPVYASALALSGPFLAQPTVQELEESERWIIGVLSRHQAFFSLANDKGRQLIRKARQAGTIVCDENGCR